MKRLIMGCLLLALLSCGKTATAIEETDDGFNVVCLEGVKYYRFMVHFIHPTYTPVVDKETLSFKRCDG